MSNGTKNITQATIHNGRGIELADRGWLDEAIREFHKAIALDPDSPHAYDNLGTIYAEKGDYLEALNSYMKAIQCEPDNPQAHHYLANFLASHAFDLSLLEYRKALTLNPDFPDAHLNLALALSDAGRLNEALNELTIAHNQSPDDELIHHELACCLIELKRLPEAITHLKTILKTHPALLEAHVDLGIAYTAQGFYDKAKESLATALALDENDFGAHYHLAALYAHWDRPAEVFEHLSNASASDNDRLRLWLQEDPSFRAFEDDPDYRGFVD
jgi:Flp pilus assembly protein TadD